MSRAYQNTDTYARVQSHIIPKLRPKTGSAKHKVLQCPAHVQLYQCGRLSPSAQVTMQHVFTLPNMQQYHRVLNTQIRHNFLHCNMPQGLNLEVLSLIPSHIHLLIFVHKWNLHLHWTQNFRNTTYIRPRDSWHLECSCVIGLSTSPCFKGS
jgi:hypothetical protein